MRRHGFFAESGTLADKEGAEKPGNCAIDVNDCASGKVKGTPLPDESGLCIIASTTLGSV